MGTHQPPDVNTADTVRAQMLMKMMRENTTISKIEDPHCHDSLLLHLFRVNHRLAETNINPHMAVPQTS